MQRKTTKENHLDLYSIVKGLYSKCRKDTLRQSNGSNHLNVFFGLPMTFWAFFNFCPPPPIPPWCFVAHLVDKVGTKPSPTSGQKDRNWKHYLRIVLRMCMVIKTIFDPFPLCTEGQKQWKHKKAIQILIPCSTQPYFLCHRSSVTFFQPGGGGGLWGPGPPNPVKISHKIMAPPAATYISCSCPPCDNPGSSTGGGGGSLQSTSSSKGEGG